MTQVTNTTTTRMKHCCWVPLRPGAVEETGTQVQGTCSALGAGSVVQTEYLLMVIGSQLLPWW